MAASGITEFAHRLSAHIRNEERVLFERLQDLVTEDEMNRLGLQLDKILQDAEQSCILPPPSKDSAAG